MIDILIEEIIADDLKKLITTEYSIQLDYIIYRHDADELDIALDSLDDINHNMYAKIKMFYNNGVISGFSYQSLILFNNEKLASSKFFVQSMIYEIPTKGGEDDEENNRATFRWVNRRM